jgi:hypothetical protein
MRVSIEHSSKINLVFGIILFLSALVFFTAAIYSLTRQNLLQSDYYIFYQAGQAVVQRGESPYSDNLARQAQLAIFKRPAAPGEDQLGFAYPLYALAMLIPTLWMSFPLAQAFWLAFNLIGLISATLICFRSAPRWMILSLIFFYPFSFGLILGNFAVLITTILFLCFAVLNRPCLPGATIQAGTGALLAWSTCKPQFVWVFLFFLLVLAYRRKAYPFILGFGAALLFLLGISFWMRPEWIQEWLASLNKYSTYNQTKPVLEFFLLQWVNMTTASIFFWIGAMCMILVTLWGGLQWWRGRLSVLAILALCGATAYLLHPRGKSYEQIVFLIPFIFWALEYRSSSTWLRAVIWFLAITLSWGIFFLARKTNAPPVTIEGLFFFYLIWMIAMWFQPSFRHGVDTVRPIMDGSPTG